MNAPTIKERMEWVKTTCPRNCGRRLPDALPGSVFRALCPRCKVYVVVVVARKAC